MLLALPAVLRIPLALLCVAANLLLHATPLLAVALVKALVPLASFRRACSGVLVFFAESWIAGNGFLLRLFTRIEWRVEGLDELRYAGWYLVLANHQSWVDIPVLQQVFNRRIPFLKFFLKQQLIWVPVLGLAWWALDFPFMRRYTKEQLERNPALRGTDLAITRRACERFRDVPVSVMNFVEGTRFSEAKHAAQASAYRNLLKPKAGGVAFVLDAMGEILQAIVDVTIVYPGGRPTVADLVAGRVREVVVHVRTLPIPADLVGGDYENDAAFRERFQQFIQGLWADKDARIDALRARP